MNRRDLLKGLMAGGIVVGGELWFPGQKLISIPKNIIYTGKDFYLDYKTRTIKFIGNPAKGASVLELHRFLQDAADDWALQDDMLDITDNNPSSRATDNIIELHDNWYITNAEYLTHGSIKQRGELWAGVKTIGHINENSYAFINDRKAIRPGHINQCVKVSEDEQITVKIKTPGMTYSKYEILNPLPGSNYAALVEQPDFYYHIPANDPAYRLFKQFGPGDANPYHTTKGARLGIREYERNI